MYFTEEEMGKEEVKKRRREGEEGEKEERRDIYLYLYLYLRGSCLSITKTNLSKVNIERGFYHALSEYLPSIPCTIKVV